MKLKPPKHHKPKNPRQFEYVVSSHCIMEVNKEQTASKINEVNVLLTAKAELEKQWKDQDGIVNKDGMKVQTQGLIQGLIANIHFAHQHGLWDSAAHLRYIIDYLEQGFVKQAKATVGEFLKDES